MPIKRELSIDIQELCTELGIQLPDLLSLIQRSNSTIDIVAQSSISNFTVNELLSKYLDHICELSKLEKRSHTTIRYYMYFLKRFQKYLTERGISQITELNESLFHEFLNTSAYKKYKSGSINTYTTILRAFLAYAYDNGFINRDLRKRFTSLNTQLLPRYLQPKDIPDVISASLKKTHGYRCHAIICLLLGTGCRVNELVNIRVNDFNCEEDILYIRKGKGNKDRYIPIYSKVKSVILDYLSITGVKEWNANIDGYLFSRDFGLGRERKLSVRSIQYMINSIMCDLNMANKYTVHSFRHTFAVNCLRAGMKLHNLSLILGHTDPRTTFIYIQLLPVDLKAEITEKFPFPFEKLIHQVLRIQE